MPVELEDAGPHGAVLVQPVALPAASVVGVADVPDAALVGLLEHTAIVGEIKLAVIKVLAAQDIALGLASKEAFAPRREQTGCHRMRVGINPIALPSTVIISGTHIPVAFIRSLKTAGLGVGKINLERRGVLVLIKCDRAVFSCVIPGCQSVLDNIENLRYKQATIFNPETLYRSRGASIK